MMADKIRRIFPYFVGGKVNGEPVPVVERGQTTLHVPYMEPVFVSLDEAMPDTVPWEELIYQRHGFYFTHTDEELHAWLGCEFDEASRIIWKALLKGVGARYEN